MRAIILHGIIIPESKFKGVIYCKVCLEHTLHYIQYSHHVINSEIYVHFRCKCLDCKSHPIKDLRSDVVNWRNEFLLVDTWANVVLRKEVANG